MTLPPAPALPLSPFCLLPCGNPGSIQVPAWKKRMTSPDTKPVSSLTIDFPGSRLWADKLLVINYPICDILPQQCPERLVGAWGGKGSTKFKDCFIDLLLLHSFVPSAFGHCAWDLGRQPLLLYKWHSNSFISSEPTQEGTHHLPHSLISKNSSVYFQEGANLPAIQTGVHTAI